MVLVPVSSDDAEIRARARDDRILPCFEACCGEDCFAAWQDKVETARPERARPTPGCRDSLVFRTEGGTGAHPGRRHEQDHD